MADYKRKLLNYYDEKPETDIRTRVISTLAIVIAFISVFGFFIKIVFF